MKPYPAFNRRHDRIRNGYIFISDSELNERGLPDKFHIGSIVVYNKVERYVGIINNEGIYLLNDDILVVTDYIGFHITKPHPFFMCPCGKGHSVSPGLYDYCLYGSGKLMYQVIAPKALAWFKENKKEHLLIK